MSDKSSIEWTDATWNPVTGCTKVGPGCDHCYAERFAERFRGVRGHPYEHGFDLVLRPERLFQPMQWHRPRMIFVNSMSDLFHKEIPSTYIDKVFDVMENANQHIFQILTKRSSRMATYINTRYSDEPTPRHIWMGVSVEDSHRTGRIAYLKQANATIRFLSFEPLLGRIGNIDLSGIDWVIVGGESGLGARPMNANWVREMRDQCEQQSVKFFFKQWGGKTSKAGGRILDGALHDDYPFVFTNEEYKGTKTMTANSQFIWHPGSNPPTIQSHTDAKLRLLKSYLDRYFDVVCAIPQMDTLRIALVDLFAGGGVFHRDGGARNGSPLVMIDAVQKAEARINLTRRKKLRIDAKFFFIDQDEHAIKYLQNTIKTMEHPTASVKCHYGQALYCLPGSS